MKLPRQVLEQTQSAIRARPELSVWVIMSALTTWLNLRRPEFTFYYDADVYWNLRLRFDNQGTTPFSLLNYDEPLRSYLQPLMHYTISKLARSIAVRDVALLEIIQAILFSSLITILIPRTISILFGCKPKFHQIALFGLCVVFFWQGYFFYPLSDFWAPLLIVLGVYFVVTTGSAWWACLLAGLVWGGAALIRPTYVICLVPLLFWLALYSRRVDRAAAPRIVVGLAAVLVGIAILFAPQVLINVRHFGVFSPMPQTQYRLGNNLYVIQLNLGIDGQRYETNIGSNYPSPAVTFVDKQGDNVLVDSHLKSASETSTENTDPSQYLALPGYLKLVLRYPLDFLVIYARHLFNGLDVVYNTPYVEDIYAPSILFRLLNYSLWFLTVLYLAKTVRPIHMLNDISILVFLLLLPAVLSIPTRLELRFMLPFYLVAYAIVSFFLLPRFLSRNGSEQLALVRQYAWVYAIFVGICFILSANTFAGLQFGQYVLK